MYPLHKISAYTVVQPIYDGIRMFTLVKTMILVFAIQKSLVVCVLNVPQRTRFLPHFLHITQEKITFILNKIWYDYGVCGVYCQLVLGSFHVKSTQKIPDPLKLG